MGLSRRLIATIAAAVAVVVAVTVGVVLGLRGDPAPPVSGPPTTAVMPSVTPSTTPTPTETPRAPTYPLTGRPLPQDADVAHPAVAVKVSNVRQAQPQAGLDRADIVFVTPIGVSYTRLVAVFHSQLPTRVGPVRSARPMDVQLLSPMVPVFGHTMAAKWVMAYVNGAPHLDSRGTMPVTAGSRGYRIDSRRPSPDHVFANPARLTELSKLKKAPKPYFSYAADLGSATAAESKGKGAGVSVPYGPGWTSSWAWDKKSKSYLRSEPWGAHRLENGKQVSATNVLVLHVASAKRKIGSIGGAPVPILDLANASGKFVALAGGHSVTGTWSKAGDDANFVLKTDDGKPLELAPGTTWVELPTPSAKVTTR
jgi:hypothetical protein